MHRSSIENLEKRNCEFLCQDEMKALECSIGKMKRGYRLVFRVARFFKRNRLFNLLTIIFFCGFGKNMTIPSASTAIFFYGHTFNNRKAFDRVIGAGVIENKRYEINGCKIPIAKRLFTLRKYEWLWYASNSAAKAATASGFAHVQLLISFSYFLLLSDVGRLPGGLRVIVVANDHSPLPNALRQVSHEFGIRTVYIQHAPVTRVFPPLRFDLAILSDRLSQNIYESIEDKKGYREKIGPVQILPALEGCFKGMRKPRKPFAIGICLTAVPNLKKTRELVLEILGLSEVQCVVIKHHPRSSGRIFKSEHNGVEEIRGNSEAREFWKKLDVCLVSNSGIAIEALHKGIPTFYDVSLDDLGFDYYGFIERGILPVFDKSLMTKESEKIIEHFDSEWRKQFVLDVGQASSSSGEALSEIKKAFRQFLN